MSALDTIYAQTITLFNRIPGRHGEPTVWIPTVIDNVHLMIGQSSNWNSHGGKTSDDVRLNIRYVQQGNDVMIPCGSADGSGTFLKKWYTPKSWRRSMEPENGITFSYGENDDFDFFVEGVVDEFPSPISDECFERKGLYAYMNAMYDNVFVITSVHKYNLIPHFELTAR